MLYGKSIVDENVGCCMVKYCRWECRMLYGQSIVDGNVGCCMVKVL